MFDTKLSYRSPDLKCYEINWIYDLYRLYNSKEFVSTMHIHWQTKYVNKCHPGLTRLALCAFDTHKDKKVKVIISDYSDSFKHLQLLTDRIDYDKNIFYSGVTIRKFDQPYFELFEKENIFSHRKHSDSNFCIFEKNILYIDDEPIMKITEREIKIFEYDQSSNKNNPEKYFETFDQFKKLVKARD